MKEIFANFTFFGVVISLAGYELGILLKKKFKFPLLNPLLVSTSFTGVNIPSSISQSHIVIPFALPSEY